MGNFLSLYLRFTSFTDLNFHSYFQTISLLLELILNFHHLYWLNILQKFLFFSDFLYTTAVLSMCRKQKFIEHKQNLDTYLAFEV